MKWYFFILFKRELLLKYNSRNILTKTFKYFFIPFEVNLLVNSDILKETYIDKIKLVH